MQDTVESPSAAAATQTARPLPANTPAERPLEYLLVGAVIALVAFGFIGYVVYHGWFVGDISKDWAYAGIGFPYVALMAGVYLFSYGWTRGDHEKALKLTFMIGLALLAVIAAAVVLLALLSKAKGSSSSSGRAAAAGESLAGSEASDHGDVHLGPFVRAVGSMLDGNLDARSRSRSAEEPAEPADGQGFTIGCQQCQRRFTPAPPRAVCPHCGHAALSA
jgi:hypothetical protein